eukprot:GHVS01062466.1.p1 GENE.GHVS01062466.1~~GHVS01062466.1.p1  ORF type:complete len:196 (-),score=39.75 GHVS01062466.1:338-925(-)
MTAPANIMGGFGYLLTPRYSLLLRRLFSSSHCDVRFTPSSASSLCRVGRRSHNWSNARGKGTSSSSSYYHQKQRTSSSSSSSSSFSPSALLLAPFVCSPAVLFTNWEEQPLLSQRTSLATSTDYIQSCDHMYNQVDLGSSKMLFFFAMFGMLLCARLAKAHTFAFTSKFNPSFFCVAHPSFMHILPRNAGAVKKT